MHVSLSLAPVARPLAPSLALQLSFCFELSALSGGLFGNLSHAKIVNRSGTELWEIAR